MLVWSAGFTLSVVAGWMEQGCFMVVGDQAAPSMRIHSSPPVKSVPI